MSDSAIRRNTKKGRDLVPKLAAEADKNEEVFFAGLSLVEREKFLRTIQKLLMQNHSDGRSPVA